jgi:hypothetical protein
MANPHPTEFIFTLGGAAAAWPLARASRQTYLKVQVYLLL